MTQSTVLFQVAGSGRPYGVSHAPSCHVVNYMAVGLWELSTCECMLDPDRPGKFYGEPLLSERYDALYAEADVVGFPSYGDELDEWVEFCNDITDEAVDHLAKALRSGLFDEFEALWWRSSDGASINLIVGKVAIDEDDPRNYVVYLIAAWSDDPLDHPKLARAISAIEAEDEDDDPDDVLDDDEDDLADDEEDEDEDDRVEVGAVELSDFSVAVSYESDDEGGEIFGAIMAAVILIVVIAICL